MEAEADTAEDIQDTVEDGTTEMEEGNVVAVDTVVGSVEDLEEAWRVSQIEKVVDRTENEAVEPKVLRSLRGLRHRPPRVEDVVRS